MYNLRDKIYTKIKKDLFQNVSLLGHILFEIDCKITDKQAVGEAKLFC